MERAALALLIAALAACAPMTAEQCRSANWYAEGERDALYSTTQPRFADLAKGCQLADPAAAEREYLEGWAAGYSELGRRTHKPG